MSVFYTSTPLRALEDRRRQRDIQEQRLRENILQKRKQRLQEATERFQRGHLPPSQRRRPGQSSVTFTVLSVHRVNQICVWSVTQWAIPFKCQVSHGEKSTYASLNFNILENRGTFFYYQHLIHLKPTGQSGFPEWSWMKINPIAGFLWFKTLEFTW